MAKNRKRRDDAVRLRQMGKILLLACACAAVGLGYVWQKNQIFRLGRDIKQREIAFKDATNRNELLETKVAQLESPAALEERIKALNINLAPPKDSQVVRLPEPTRASPQIVATQTQPQKTPTPTPTATQTTSTTRPPTAAHPPQTQPAVNRRRP